MEMFVLSSRAMGHFVFAAKDGIDEMIVCRMSKRVRNE
jgi:hypothetical protein